MEKQYLISVEGKERDREAEGVQHLVLHRREEDVELLPLRADRAGAEVGVTRDRSEIMNVKGLRKHLNYISKSRK